MAEEGPAVADVAGEVSMETEEASTGDSQSSNE